MGEHTDSNTENEATAVPLGRPERRSIAINGMFLLMVLYFLYFAAPVLVPITLAVLLNLLLSRPVQLLCTLGVPRSLGAAVVVCAVVCLTAASFYALSGPAQSWLERMPGSFHRVEQKLHVLKKPIEETKKVIDRVEEATELGQDPSIRKVEIDRPGLTDSIFSGTVETVAAIGVVIVLLSFLLASGDTFLRNLVVVIPTFEDKKRAVDIIRSIQTDISFYLVAITAMNAAVGISVVIVASFAGVPDPFLWGGVAGLLSFAPYVGPAIVSGLLLMEGMLTFDSLWSALAVAGIYAVIVVAANSIVLPIVLGRRLTLSPVAIFITLIVWGWLWGIPGALLAVPLLTSFKIVCERIVPLQPIAEFLSS